jgi:hypothetical protein
MFSELVQHLSNLAYDREITLYLTHTMLQPVVGITTGNIYYIVINRALFSSSSTQRFVKSITRKIYAKYIAGKCMKARQNLIGGEWSASLYIRSTLG